MLNINSMSEQWQSILKNEFDKSYFVELTNFLNERKKTGAVIFPPQDLIFNAFNITNFNDVKVVILGQDPYHRQGQAHGLSFSVNKDTRPLPPSLRNIYKELNADLGLPIPSHGCLHDWAKQGVLLINAVLTVEQGAANCHAKKGWEQFTDYVIKTLAEQKQNVVFILWGAYAQKKAGLIDESKHLIIKSAHPSPFSARNGFFGSKPFSITNNYLKSTNQVPIDWIIKENDLLELINS